MTAWRALAIVVAVLAAQPALADDKAEAVKLFDEGIKNLKAGNYEQACAALRRSNELHADSGTRGSLARCYEKRGKVASAWRLWVDLSSTAPVRLRPDAAANAKKLEPRLPRYVIRLPAGGPQQIGATIDGETIDAAPDTPVPIDPGSYVFEANAAGYVGWKHTFTAVEGETVELAVDLQPVPKQVAPPQPKPVERPARPSSSRRTIGLALLGVGGALVIGGGVFGIIAKGHNDDAKDLCGGDIDRCDPARLGEAQDKVDSARTTGNVATVGFVAGGAAIVTGIVLLVTAPKTERGLAIAPAVGAGSVGLVLARDF